MASRSSRSSTRTSRFIWWRPKPTKAEWLSFVMKCDHDVRCHEDSYPNRGGLREQTLSSAGGGECFDGRVQRQGGQTRRARDKSWYPADGVIRRSEVDRTPREEGHVLRRAFGRPED